MSNKETKTPMEWNDSVVSELHAIRQELLEKYQGDMHAYSKAASAHALQLGFKLVAKIPSPALPTTD
jgi:hypothetical protein